MGSHREASHDYPEFMKHYISEINSQALRIPPAFVEKYGNVPQKAKLEGPGGRSWSVVVRKVDGDFFFQDGWPEFVKDNALEELNFLTFSFSGSKFYVKIFGKNGSKKVIPTCPRNGKKARLHNLTVLSGKSTSDRVIPQFEVILNSTYVTKLLMVTKSFSQNYIKTYYDTDTDRRVERKVILQIKDKSWEVKAWKSGLRYQLCTGWLKFVRDNLLEEGDHCKFELIKKNPFVLNVTITKHFQGHSHPDFEGEYCKRRLDLLSSITLPLP